MAAPAPDLPALFAELKAILAEFSPPLVVTKDAPGSFELSTPNPVVINGKRRPNLFFAAVTIQGSFVGFYYMPVYTDAEAAALFSPRLLKMRKGKSCFHVKGMDDELESQIRAVLREGIDLYREKGWLLVEA